MRLAITIDTDNAAFDALGTHSDISRAVEAGRILAGVARDLVQGNWPGSDGWPLRDANGNSVGAVEAKP